MNSMDNTITVSKTASQIRRNSVENNEKFQNFVFYLKIQSDNIVYLVDTKEAHLLFDKIEFNYALIKEKWKACIFKIDSRKFTAHKNTILPITSTTKHNDINFKFKNNFHENIVLLLLQHSRKDKLSFSSHLCNGPPNEFRWLSWLSVVFDRYDFSFTSEEEYKRLLDIHLNKEVDVQIKKDLNRSAPQVPYFQKEESRTQLYNVLKAIAVLDPELAYCQGMNIITAHLLLVSDGNEVEVFNVVRYMLSVSFNVKLREFYLNGFPRLNMFIFLLKEIIKEKLPEISKKIDILKVPDELWLFKWLQSLFSIILPFCVVVRLWDCIFSFGIEFILNYSVVFIFYSKDKILRSNDVGDFLESLNMQFKCDKEMVKFREKIIKDAKNFTISENLVMRLKLKFEKVEFEKFNFNKFDKNNKSFGLSSTNATDQKSNPLEGKHEIGKIEANLRYISEVSESDKDCINDIDQINLEIEKNEEDEKKKNCEGKEKNTIFL